jgi:porin
MNGNSAGLTGEPFMIRNGRWGAYAIANQRLSRPVANSDHGLRVGGFAGIGDRQTSQYRYFWAGGGVYQGIFRRESDFVSFAVSYAATNPRLTQFQEDRTSIHPGSVPVQTFESILEADYNVQARRWLSVRPNVQCVIKPNGTGKILNAFVIGLCTGVTF